MRLFTLRRVVVIILFIVGFYALFITHVYQTSISITRTLRKLQQSDFSRYESVEIWRTGDSFEPTYFASPNRPKLPSRSSFRSDGEYLKQPLIADFAKGSDKVFLMIKTGGSEMWSKLPIHLLTTLTKFPYFALYSDAPGSIAGYEVIDILANVSQDVKNELLEFRTTYALQKWLHDTQGVYDYSQAIRNLGWDLDRFKNIPMLMHAYDVAAKGVEWFVFIDADSYLFSDNLLTFLNQFDSNEYWYLGSAVPGEPHYFAHGGSGVAISKAALTDTVGVVSDADKQLENFTIDSCCGDLVVGQMMLAGLNLNASTGYNLELPQEDQWYRSNMPNIRETSFQGNSIWDVQVTKHNWCMPLVSFHHVTNHDIERLYEFERLLSKEKRSNITYGDIYHNFYEPFIVEVRQDWDNNSRDVTFSREKDLAGKKYNNPETIRPYQSPEYCQLTCEYVDECLAWRWLPFENYCGLNTAVRLGHPAHDAFVFSYDQDEGIVLNNTNAVSGWMLDRIEQIQRMC